MQTEGLIHIRRIEVEANKGTPEVNWFDKYSDDYGGAITPTIKIVDRYHTEIGTRVDTVKILHLWEEKGEILEESDKKKSKQLKEHIVEAIENYRRRSFRPFHNPAPIARLAVPRMV